MKYIKKINLRTLVCITIITVIISTFFSLASYHSALSGSGKGQVASVALSIDNETTLNLPIGPLDSDSEQSFEFEIFNKSDKRKNEVTMKYYIENSLYALLKPDEIDKLSVKYEITHDSNDAGYVKVLLNNELLTSARLYKREEEKGDKKENFFVRFFKWVMAW